MMAFGVVDHVLRNIYARQRTTAGVFLTLLETTTKENKRKDKKDGEFRFDKYLIDTGKHSC